MADILVYTKQRVLLHKQDKLQDDPDKSENGHYFWKFRGIPRVSLEDKIYFATEGFIKGFFIIEKINLKGQNGNEFNSLEWDAKSWTDIKPISMKKAFLGFKYVDNIKRLGKD